MSGGIRAMCEGDVDRVLAIADALPAAPHWPRAAYLAALGSGGAPQRVALVAEQGATIVGFAVASLVEGQAELESIAVAVEAQGRGIGRMLLTRLIDATRWRGAGELILELRESNRTAEQLYKRVGFEEVGRRRGYYREPMEDAVLMRLAIGK